MDDLSNTFLEMQKTFVFGLSLSYTTSVACCWGFEWIMGCIFIQRWKIYHAFRYNEWLQSLLQYIFPGILIAMFWNSFQFQVPLAWKGPSFLAYCWSTIKTRTLHFCQESLLMGWMSWGSKGTTFPFFKASMKKLMLSQDGFMKFNKCMKERLKQFFVITMYIFR